MATIKDISEMAAYIASLNEPILRSANLSLVKAVNKAENNAKRNVTKTFKGSRDRPKTGQLTAAVFSGYEFEGRSPAASGFVGVRSKKGSAGTKPYGRIHEYGGIVRPKKAKYLWIPLFGPRSSGVLGRFNNMTPREFVKKMIESKKAGETTFEHWGGKNKAGHRDLKKKRAVFSIFRSMNNELIAWYSERTGSGRSAREKGFALFLLRTKVIIPARPYIGPAVRKAWAELPDGIKKDLEGRTID